MPSPYSAQMLACSMLTGQTRPAQPSSARRPSTAARKSPLYCSIIDSSRLPPVWPREPRVLEHRQPRQQHAPRLALVARQRERALQHVARRQHAQLVAQLPGAPAAVEHRDDGVDVQPRVRLQAAEQARQAGAAAEAPDVQRPQLHRLVHSIGDADRMSMDRMRRAAGRITAFDDNGRMDAVDAARVSAASASAVTALADTRHASSARGCTSLVAYGLDTPTDDGSLHSLALVERLTFEDLAACAAARRRLAPRAARGAAAAVAARSSSARSTSSRSSTARSSRTTSSIVGRRPVRAARGSPTRTCGARASCRPRAT